MTPLDALALALILVGAAILSLLLYVNRRPARNYRDES